MAKFVLIVCAVLAIALTEAASSPKLHGSPKTFEISYSDAAVQEQKPDCPKYKECKIKKDTLTCCDRAVGAPGAICFTRKSKPKMLQFPAVQQAKCPEFKECKMKGGVLECCDPKVGAPGAICFKGRVNPSRG